jgi:hypothetical protein
MTTWTNLSNSAVSVAGIPSGSTITALRDNVSAVAEGSTGAPRISGDAAARESTGLTVVAVTASDAVTLQQGAGEEALLTTTTSSSNVVGHRYTINAYSGVIRFKATISCAYSDPGDQGILQLFKNGTQIGSTTTATTSAVAVVIDSTIAVADVFEWRFKQAGTVVATLSAVSITANDGYVNQPLYILASNV